MTEPSLPQQTQAGEEKGEIAQTSGEEESALPARTLGWVLFLVCAGIALGLAVMASPTTGLAAALWLLALILALRQPLFLIWGLTIWLPLLGIVRRVPALSVDAASINPLLIVGPFATGLLLISARRTALRGMTGLAWSVGAFNVLTSLSALNPAQGGLKVGLGGLFFLLVPVLWFWLGRGIVDDLALERLLKLIVSVAVVAALYGLWQTIFGFPSWDQAWIREKGYAYTALNVRGSNRPFSIFSNGTEYATYLGIALVALWAGRKKAFSWLTAIGVSLVLIPALFLTAVRGALVFTAFALVVLWVGFSRVSGLAKVGILSASLLAISFTGRLVGEMHFSDPTLQSLVDHQVKGIGNPLDPEQSTLGAHTSMLVDGVKSAFRKPLGYGPGAVSLASSKLGGKALDTEADFSNAAVGMGLPGLVLFVYVAGAACFLAFRSAWKERTFPTLAAVGILVVTGLHWLTGGQYSTAPLPWLFLGWLDRKARDARSGDGVTERLDRGQVDAETEWSTFERRALDDSPLLPLPPSEPVAPRPIPPLPDRPEQPVPPERELEPVGSVGRRPGLTSRLIDLVLAFVGLVVLSPVLLFVSILIRLSTGASPLFSQTRLGKDGRPFRLVKLRTLLPSAPSQVPKKEAEHTATRLGEWLRALKLDEAPQLWNVLKGEMSIVGPRPIIPEEYSEKSHYQRLAVRPGITGLWQLSKARGHPFDESPEYDLFYLANRSLAFDLWIMWRTVLLVFFRKETGMALASMLWERDPSWRQTVPRAAAGIPARSPMWRPAFTLAVVACIGVPVTLILRAGIGDRGSNGSFLRALRSTAAREGPRLIAWTIAVYAAVGVALVLFPLLASRRPGLMKRVAWAAGGLVVLLLAIAIPPVLAARSHLQAAKVALARVSRSSEGADLATVERELDSVRLLALSARDELESPLTSGARFIPIAHSNIKAAQTLASGVASIIPAVNQSIALAAALGPQGPGDAPIFQKGRFDLEKLSQLPVPLEAAAATARSAVASSKDVGGLLMPPVRRALTEFAQAGNGLAKALDSGARVGRLLPALMGADAPRTYFLMIQNGSEQRATGGYLGAFGILRVNGGQLALDRFDANSALPAGDLPAPPPSPEFAERYDRFEARSAWYNVNMTPDFPTASQVISELWQKRTGQAIDGVVAVDAVALAQLLKVTGPVNVPELPQPVTSRNFVRTVLNDAYVRFPEKGSRVDFLMPIGRQVWERLLNGDGLDTASLVRVIGHSFATKHMQVWTRQEEATFGRLGIDGRLKPARGRDYLFVVGQNAAGNKVDFYAKRSIKYEVEIAADGTTSSTVGVKLENRAPSAGLPPYVIGPFGNLPDPPGLNRSYVSLYLPRDTASAGATLNDRPVGLESHVERNLSVLSKYVEVPAGKSSRLEVQLESKLDKPGHYRLLLQHQPELDPDHIEVSVKVPDGTVVTGMSEGMRVKGRTVVWKGSLTRDKELDLRFSSSLSDRLRSALHLRPLMLVF